MLSPGPTLQEVAPAQDEVVIWSAGQVREVPGVCEGSGRVNVRGSVLQHRLVALEHTLGNLWSSALQGDLQGEESGEGLNMISFISCSVKNLETHIVKEQNYK